MSFKNARLYGILDLGYVQPSAVETMTAALCRGGVDLLQLRAKKADKREIEGLARRMQAVLKDFSVPLIINDHADIAAEIGCFSRTHGRYWLTVHETGGTPRGTWSGSWTSAIRAPEGGSG